MTDVSVCQTEVFQAVWRFLRLFRTDHDALALLICSSTSLWSTLLFPILILIIAVTMTKITKIENGVS
jgi:hypothetical protein